MILAVDDDADTLEQVRAALAVDGLTVEIATSGAEAIERARVAPPTLVISDMMMPEMDGLQFRRAYAQAFPERATPFLFLSSMGDPDTIVAGLDAGADDYCVKPVSIDVLRAKVRVVLRRALRQSGHSFRGDLEHLTVPRLLHYCEQKGLTGYVDIFRDGRPLTLYFDAGRIDEARSSEALATVLQLTDGPFEIHSTPIGFHELGGVGGAARPASPETPLGRISSVRIGGRQLQVQTEVVPPPEPFVVTLVTIEGRPMWKRRDAYAPTLERDALRALVDTQHETVEREVESKLAAALATVPKRNTKEEFNQLCDRAFDCFRSRDYDGAIAAWQRAHELDPESTSVAINLKIAREKRDAGRSKR